MIVPDEGHSNYRSQVYDVIWHDMRK